jgi:hypothetical protein
MLVGLIFNSHDHCWDAGHRDLHYEYSEMIPTAKDYVIHATISLSSGDHPVSILSTERAWMCLSPVIRLEGA